MCGECSRDKFGFLCFIACMFHKDDKKGPMTSLQEITFKSLFYAFVSSKLTQKVITDERLIYLFGLSIVEIIFIF